MKTCPKSRSVWGKLKTPAWLVYSYVLSLEQDVYCSNDSTVKIRQVHDIFYTNQKIQRKENPNYYVFSSNSLILQVFIEHLPCDRLRANCWAYNGEQDKQGCVLPQIILPHIWLPIHMWTWSLLSNNDEVLDKISFRSVCSIHCLLIFLICVLNPVLLSKELPLPWPVWPSD